MKTLKIMLKSSIAVAIIAVAISCETVTNPKPIQVIDSTRTATISGTAFANLDERNDDPTLTNEENFERAPANTIVKVVLNANDFSNSANPQQKLTYSTTVDGSGNFTIEVPAVDSEVFADIYMDSFSATQTKADSTQQEEIFTAPNPRSVGITAELTTFVDVIYSVR